MNNSMMIQRVEWNGLYLWKRGGIPSALTPLRPNYMYVHKEHDELTQSGDFVPIAGRYIKPGRKVQTRLQSGLSRSGSGDSAFAMGITSIVSRHLYSAKSSIILVGQFIKILILVSKI